jgi:hypothetical protein
MALYFPPSRLYWRESTLHGAIPCPPRPLAELFSAGKGIVWVGPVKENGTEFRSNANKDFRLSSPKALYSPSLPSSCLDLGNGHLGVGQEGKRLRSLCGGNGKHFRTETRHPWLSILRHLPPKITVGAGAVEVFRHRQKQPFLTA